MVAYRAQVEPLASPIKKTKLDSASDSIIQEVYFYKHILALKKVFVCFLERRGISDTLKETGVTVAQT